MKKLFITASSAALAMAAALVACSPKEKAAATEAEEEESYVFVFHTDPTHSLFMATSDDGYNFVPLNNGDPIVAGDTIAFQKGIRDPHIFRGPDGAYYIAMTDLHIFGREHGYRDTEWERDGKIYDWGNNRGFVLMKSNDLINWTRSNLIIQDQFPDLDVACAWAPETTFDPVEGKPMLYFTMRLTGGKTKLYYAYTDSDFTKLVSRPEILFNYPNPEVQILDADISRTPDGRYCLTYVAQENPGGIRMAFSDSIHSGYEYVDEWADLEPGACEAPNVWKRNGEDKWVVMYDVFSIQPHNFGYVETSDFKNFTDLGHFNDSVGPMKIEGIVSPKHGAVISVPRSHAQKLREHWEKNPRPYNPGK